MSVDRSPSPSLLISGKTVRDRLSLWETKFAVISSKQQDGITELSNLAPMYKQVLFVLGLYSCGILLIEPLWIQNIV